jgi:hypothetical protein
MDGCILYLGLLAVPSLLFLRQGYHNDDEQILIIIKNKDGRTKQAQFRLGCVLQANFIKIKKETNYVGNG